MKIKYLFIVVTGLLLVIIAYNYIYKEHRIVAEETSDFTVTSKDLYDEFSDNIQVAMDKYLDKIITVKGSITEIDALGIMMDDKVYCYLESEIIDKERYNEQIVVKGRCIGYDDLLEQIKLDQCTIIN